MTTKTIIIVIKDTKGFLTEKGLPVKKVLSRTEGGHCSQISDKLSWGREIKFAFCFLDEENQDQ